MAGTYKCTKCGNTWYAGGSSLPPENCPSGGKHSWIEISSSFAKMMLNNIFNIKFN